jgi:hypothetical protein
MSMITVQDENATIIRGFQITMLAIAAKPAITKTIQ